MFGSKRLKELEEELRKIRRMVEERDLDWVDMRSRCKRLLDRTEKAAARISEGTDVPSPDHVTDSENGVSKATQGRQLTPRQLAVQQSILRRRAGV